MKVLKLAWSDIKGKTSENRGTDPNSKLGIHSDDYWKP